MRTVFAREGVARVAENGTSERFLTVPSKLMRASRFRIKVNERQCASIALARVDDYVLGRRLEPAEKRSRR